MRTLLAQRRDEQKLAARAEVSQRNRLFVQEAMKEGVFPSRDYTPPFDAARAFVRGVIDPNTTATKARKRFPSQQHRLKSPGLVERERGTERKNEYPKAESKVANNDCCEGTQPPLFAPKIYCNYRLRGSQCYNKH